MWNTAVHFDESFGIHYSAESLRVYLRLVLVHSFRAQVHKYLLLSFFFLFGIRYSVYR